MTSRLDVEVLTIGDELNRGEIVDTNSTWLAERLTEVGAHVRWRTSVNDEPRDLAAALRAAAGRAQVVVCSGGLGPTDDDRTVDVGAALAGVEPVIDPEHEARMRTRFAARNFRLTPNNLRQVRVPAGAEVLANRKGLAPGFRLELEGCQLFFMPGVPREMKPMFDEEVTPRLRPLLGKRPQALRRTFRIAGLGESHVDHALAGLLDGVPDATLHYRIAFPEILVTIVLWRASAEEAAAVLTRLGAELGQRLTSHHYGTDDETLPQVVGRLLLDRRATLAVAESCTGGLLGELLTRTPGASAYFRGGVIAYANEAKVALLGVRPETLDSHGAVSQATVLEMAEGARRAFDASFGAAVSGIAGPDGGTADKPVGTVELAVVGPGGIAEGRQVYWPGEREQVRLVAAFAALQLLHRLLTRPAAP